MQKTNQRILLLPNKPKDIFETLGYCGITELEEKNYLLKNTKSNTGPITTLVQQCRMLELATDADFEYFQLFGGDTNNDILATINLLQGVYFNTFNMDITVVNQNVWTISSDPYTGNPSTDPGSLTLVTELRNYWQANRQNVNRDLVHLFTGKDFNQAGILGRAYDIGTVCVSPDKSYSFTKGRLNQFLTTAHEIGHNFGGLHGDGQDCGTANASIMCQGDKRDPMYFSSASISRIGGFINANAGCLIPFTQTAISGPSAFCTTGSAIYTISNLPTGATITWSTTGSLSIPPGSTGASVNANVNGNGTLEASIVSPCGNISISKTIIVGLSVSSYVDRTPQASNYQYLTATVVQLPSTVPSNYRWYREVNGGSTLITTGLQLLQYPIPPCTTVYYKLVATTPCGELVYTGYAFNNKCGSYAISSSMVAYPNPANTELNISNTEEAGDLPINESGANEVNAEFQVKLYDAKGNILRSAKNPKGNKGVTLDIIEVPNGTYYLHIFKGKEVFKKQIIISHQ